MSVTCDPQKTGNVNRDERPFDHSAVFLSAIDQWRLIAPASAAGISLSEGILSCHPGRRVLSDWARLIFWLNGSIYEYRVLTARREARSK